MWSPCCTSAAAANHDNWSQGRSAGVGHGHGTWTIVAFRACREEKSRPRRTSTCFAGSPHSVRPDRGLGPTDCPRQHLRRRTSSVTQGRRRSRLLQPIQYVMPAEFCPLQRSIREAISPLLVEPGRSDTPNRYSISSWLRDPPSRAIDGVGLGCLLHSRTRVVR